MGKKLFWKILIACFLALSAMFTVAGSMIISWIPPVQQRLLTTVLGLAGIGGFLTLAGLLRAQAVRRKAAAQSAESNPDMIHPLAFLGYLHFWGTVLVISATPMFFLNRFQQTKTYAKEPPPKIAVVSRAPVVFPVMRLQGLVCNESRSSAVIDGQTVEVGDMLQGVHVVSIDSLGVTVALEGLTNRLTLE